MSSVPVKRKRSASLKRRWSDKAKQQAAETYVILNGNIEQTAITNGIPQQTVFGWTKTQWWKDIVDELKQQDNINISMRLQKVLSKSLAVVENRLDQGDVFYDQKLGKVVRKEVSLRDAQALMRDSFVIKEQIEKPQIVMDNQSISDKLTELANKFSEFASNKKPTIEVTDVVFIEEKPLTNEQVKDVDDTLDFIEETTGKEG